MIVGVEAPRYLHNIVVFDSKYAFDFSMSTWYYDKYYLKDGWWYNSSTDRQSLCCTQEQIDRMAEITEENILLFADAGISEKYDETQADESSHV